MDNEQKKGRIAREIRFRMNYMHYNAMNLYGLTREMDELLDLGCEEDRYALELIREVLDIILTDERLQGNVYRYE